MNVPSPFSIQMAIWARSVAVKWRAIARDANARPSSAPATTRVVPISKNPYRDIGAHYSARIPCASAPIGASSRRARARAVGSLRMTSAAAGPDR